MKLNNLDRLVIWQTMITAGEVATFWKPLTLLNREDEWSENWTGETEMPFVSIIVPARNEEGSIERCVTSLLAQNYPNYEVIAVDDGSQDATPQILARLAEGKNDHRLRIVRLGELPPGWAGKPHAMHAGTQAANPASQWFLFTDADTKHQPHALCRAVIQASNQQTDLLSVLPKLELKSFWERVLMPLAVLGISLQYPLDKVNAPHSKLAIANGQFLLVRRPIFEQVGGFGGKLKTSIVDDRDLALAVKADGGSIRLYNGRDLLSVRMYHNLGEIWRGWRKNAFVGSRSAYISVPFFIVMMWSNGILPLLQLAYALLKLPGAKNRTRWQLWAGLSGLQLGLQAVIQYRMARAMEIPRGYSFSSPLAALMFSGILLDSMWRSITGRGVSWKGRNYAQAARTQQMIK